MTESSLFSSIVLPSICNYCNGSASGKKNRECEYFFDCEKLVWDGFEIPKTKEKINSYIENYRNGKSFFEIAKLIWGIEDPETIRTTAQEYQSHNNTIQIVGPDNILMGKLSESEEPSVYMEKKLKELENMKL